MNKLWTADDAYMRVQMATYGCLDPAHVSNEYLQQLERSIVAWLERIQREQKIRAAISKQSTRPGTNIDILNIIQDKY